MEQFIADITKEFNLNPEGVALYKKMFEDAVVSGKQMYGTEEEATAFAVRVVRTAFEDDEEYECYCQECGEVIEGMTEEEFEEDDELKLCAKCEEVYKVDGLDEFPKMFAELVAGGMSEKEAGRVLAKGVISAVRSALDKAE